MSRSSIFKTKGYIPPQSGGGSVASVSTDNLIAYWNFDSVSDLASIPPTFGSSSYTLLANSGDGFQGSYPPPVATTGKVGANALQFDGPLSGEGLYIPTGTFPLLTTFTISCWVKLTGNHNNNNIIACHWDGSGPNWNFIFIIANDNHLHIAVQPGGAGAVGEAIATNIDFTDGNWHHCVAQSDGSTFVRTNVDNTGWHSVSLAGSLAGGSNGVPFLIGRNTRQGVNTASINLDELGIWTRVLTDNEITSLYNSGNGLAYPFSGGGGGGSVLATKPARILIKGYNPLTDIGGGGGGTTNSLLTNILAYWPLNETVNSGSRVDSTGNGHTLLDNRNNVSYTSNGRGGNAAVFVHNNSCSLITQDGNILLPTTTFSASLWVKITNAGQSGEIIGNVTGNNWAGGGIQFDYNGNGTLLWGALYGDPNTSNRFTTGSSNIADGNWHHLVGTYSNGNKKVYIDGTLFAQQNDSSSTPIGGNGSCHISLGSNSDNSYSPLNMDGQLSDVGIWNRELTSSEVTTLYASGNGLSYPFGLTPTNPINNNLQAFWNFDEASGPRADATGNGYTISEVNGTIPSGNGVVAGGGAANIANGNSSWLKLPAGICDIGTGQKSFSIWFKLNQTNIGYQFIWCQGHNYDFADNNIVYTENGSFLSTIFLSTTENHWNAYNLGGNIYPTPNVWHHYVITYSGSQVTAYYDGNQIAQFGYSGSISTDNTEYTLGHYNAFPNGINGQPGEFHGLIDDVGIWNRVLTPSDVAYLYNTGQGRQYPLYTPPVQVPPKFKILIKGYQKPVPQNSFITDGLILLLDATDPASYPGTGGVWTDISGNSNNFNINPAAWNPAGYMDFKGSYGMAKNSSDITLSGDVTYLCLTRILNSTGNWRTLTRAYGSPGNHQVIVQAGGWDVGTYISNGPGFRDTGYSQQSLPGYASNSFDVMCWRWTNNDNPTYDFNVNNTHAGSITDSAARYTIGFGSIGGYMGIGGSTDPNVGDQFWGDIKFFAVYNRRLTDAEVTQNYNAMVAKFGL